jgi:hypothetical protein
MLARRAGSQPQGNLTPQNQDLGGHSPSLPEGESGQIGQQPRHALLRKRPPSGAAAMRVFRYSIAYLTGLLLALLLDHYLPTTQRP